MARSKELHNAVRRARLKAKGVVAEDIKYADTSYAGEQETHCCLCDTAIKYNFLLVFNRPSGVRIDFMPVGSECITDWAEAMPPSKERDALLAKVQTFKTQIAKEQRQAKATTFAEVNKLEERYHANKLAKQHRILSDIIRTVNAQGYWNSPKQAQFFLSLLQEVEKKSDKGLFDKAASKPEAPKEPVPDCPKCKNPMKLRHGPYGDFFGCSQYPNCRGILKLDEGKKLAAKKAATPVMPPTPPAPSSPACPRCQAPTKPRMTKVGQVYGCSKHPACQGVVMTEEQKQKAKSLMQKR